MTANPDTSKNPSSLAISLDPPDELLYSLSALSLLFKECLGKPETSRNLRGIVEKLNIQLNSNSIGLRSTSIQELVNSLGEDYKRWCLLEAETFTAVTRTLLRARNCLERDQGLFRLIEVLETLTDRVETRVMESDTVKNYKDTVGEGSILELFSFFTEEENLDFTRRWVGLLLAELLDGSEQNRKRLLRIEKKQLEELGDIIERGTDRMLKIVAGKIIWQTIRSSGVVGDIRDRLEIFWAQDSIHFSKDFPMEPGSQWDGGFAQFVTRLEEDLDDLDIGLFPTAFNAYQVRLGESKPQVFGRGAVSISIGELFSIYIPPNSDGSCEWIDIKITNITKIEPIDEAVPGDLKGQLRYLKLHLSDSSESGYLYLISMRPSSRFDSIMVSCYAEEADDIVENVERCRGLMLSSMQGNAPHISAAGGMLVNPEITQSQKEKEEELQKRRGYVLDAVNSPAGAEATFSGQSESGEILSVDTADLEGTCGGASPPIIGRSLGVHLPAGAKASVGALRPPSIETSPKRIWEASKDCSPLSSPTASGGILASQQGYPSGLTDHPVVQMPKSSLFRATKCNFVGSTGLRGLGENKPSQTNEAPTDGLSSILQRVPSLMPLEEVKKRGKLKDRLANERGEVPTPPSLQKQNTGRKRATAKQPMAPARPVEAKKPVSGKSKNGGITKNIKPVLPRKKPEPLPISDDIWELPLSSPVSQGLKAGGGVKKHNSGIGQKAKHVPNPADMAKGRLEVEGKVVTGNRGRRKGRSYKSEARVVDSSAEESTPSHPGSETVGPGAARPPGKMEMETGKSAPPPQPKALTKTVQTTHTSEAQPSLRRSLRERKPPKAMIIPSSSGEGEREGLVEHTPEGAPVRLLSPGKKRRSVTTNKRALPQAYKTNASVKKRKEAPILEGVSAIRASDIGRRGVRRGARAVQLGGRQKGAGGPRAARETSAVAPEHIQTHRTTAVSSKRKAQKTTVTPKELAQGSHKRQRTSPPGAVGHDRRGEAHAPTFGASGSPESVASLSQMDGSSEAQDSIGERPDLAGWGTGSHGTLPPLNKKEYINHGESREDGRTSDISSPEIPPEPSAHSPQTVPRVIGGPDDPSKGASAHGGESQKHHHSSLESFPKGLVPPETVNDLAKRSSSIDIPGASTPSGPLAVLYDLRENLQRNAPIASANISKAPTPRPILNLVDASTSTSDLNECRTMSSSHSWTSSPPSQITGESVPMMQLKDKVTCDRAVSADAVPKAAINEPHLLSPIEFSKENSPTGLMIHSTTYDEELSMPNDLAKLSTNQRLKNLVILSEGDEDIVVWDTREKKGGLILQRTETGHAEVDENGSPSSPDASKSPTRLKQVSWEMLNKPMDSAPEPSQGRETEENMFVENSPSVPGERIVALGRQLSAEQTHHLARASPKGGKSRSPSVSTGDEGGWEYFKHKEGAGRYIDGSKNQSAEQLIPLGGLRKVVQDVISISSTSPSPVLPPPLPQKEPHKIHQRTEPWEDSDDPESMEPAIAKVLQILAKRGANMPKSSPPVLHHLKPKVQLSRDGKRELGDSRDLIQSARVEVTNTEDGPFKDVALARKRHPKTRFSKMPQKQRFVKIQRPPCRGNLSDQRLTEEQFHRASRVVPIKGGDIRRQEWTEDPNHDELDGDTEVEDYMSAYTDEDGPDMDSDTYSDSESSESSDSEDGGEDDQEGSEDAYIIWRKSLPKHLNETLSALEQITRGLVKYLACGEELAIEMIEDFEARGKNLIQGVDDSHRQEYDEFLENLEEAKKAVAARAEELDRVIRNGLDSVERKEEDWKNSQIAGKKQHQKLDDAIEKMLMDTNN